MRLPLIALVLAATALAPQALAQSQDRTPAVRQSLVDLAYVLGEAHALRQACQGEDDQYWRTRMIRMVDTEQPDAGLDRRLKESFNTGFASRQGEFPTCTGATRRAEIATAARGQSLAAQLSQVMNKVQGDPPPTLKDMNADLGHPPVASRPAPR
jgi:uncharacterized protein (TIGR02301 family)